LLESGGGRSSVMPVHALRGQDSLAVVLPVDGGLVHLDRGQRRPLDRTQDRLARACLQFAAIEGIFLPLSILQTAKAEEMRRAPLPRGRRWCWQVGSCSSTRCSRLRQRRISRARARMTIAAVSPDAIRNAGLGYDGGTARTRAGSTGLRHRIEGRREW